MVGGTGSVIFFQSITFPQQRPEEVQTDFTSHSCEWRQIPASKLRVLCPAVGWQATQNGRGRPGTMLLAGSLVSERKMAPKWWQSASLSHFSWETQVTTLGGSRPFRRSSALMMQGCVQGWREGIINLEGCGPTPCRQESCSSCQGSGWQPSWL